MSPDSSSPLSEHDLDYGPTLRGLREGSKVFERYTLVRMLGRGGMGVVWLAHDERLDLDIALKFLPENLTHDEVAIEDLRRETRRCVRLTHTNIVHVYDLLEDKTTAAIAMEFVDGQSLSALRMEKPARVLEAADLAPLVRQVCDALTYAHENARVVHQDLKPANLMLTHEGIMKVMDFGIASSIHDSASRLSQRSTSGTGAGTLPYMSPQQLTGCPASISDDVYALGATLYELLTGKPPFYRGSLETQIQSIVPPAMMQRRAELNLESTGTIPQVWEQTIAACLEKEPAKRPQNVREVWQRLSGAQVPPPAAREAVKQSVRGSAAAKAQERSVGAPTRTTSSRKPLLLTIVCVVVIALALMTVPRQKTTESQVPSQTEANDFNTAQIGDSRVVDLGSGVKLTLCYCPPGSFTMGSPASEAGRSDNEDQVPVKISRGYWLAKTEWTQAQWRAVMGTEPSYFKGDELPVEQVSWQDAQEFMVKLNGKNVLPAGWKWSLPSEAQWEYACRAGTTTPYAGELERMAWYDVNSDNKTQPVGAKAANAWGLHDMHGNVWELCSDWYGGKLPGGTDPMGALPDSLRFRVDRGGSWGGMGRDCRSANRGGAGPGASRTHIGFRAAAVQVEGVAATEEKERQKYAPPVPEQSIKNAVIKKSVNTDFNTAQIGDTRVVDLGSGVELTLCYIPPGSFTMGSPASEAGRSDNEDQVQVRLTQGYWLAKTECTQAQWRALMNTDPSHFNFYYLPVEQVSWEDAQEFMAKLNGKNVLPAGWKWSLPTEAQWEYACRAGTTAPYAGELEHMAWYHDNSGSTTHPVGTKAANAWGLQDMHGNVYEWCSDWFADDLPGGTNPTGAASGSARVNRGGSWNGNGQYCRGAYRRGSDPGNRFNILGFRAAAVPESQPVIGATPSEQTPPAKDMVMKPSPPPACTLLLRTGELRGDDGTFQIQQTHPVKKSIFIPLGEAFGFGKGVSRFKILSARKEMVQHPTLGPIDSFVLKVLDLSTGKEFELTQGKEVIVSP